MNECKICRGKGWYENLECCGEALGNGECCGYPEPVQVECKCSEETENDA